MSQEYLLENDDAAWNIADLNQFWTSNINTNKGPRARLGIVSKVLENIQVFAYDHPAMVKKYPYGLHTENTILFNSAVIEAALEQLHEDDSRLRDQTENQKIIVSAVLDLLEDNYKISFTPEQRFELTSSALAFTITPNEKNPPRLESVSVIELENFAREAGIPEENSQYKKKIGSSIDSINAALFDSREVHNPANPLNQIAYKVVELQAESMPFDLNPDLATFRANYVNGSYADNSAYANKVMRHLLSEAIQNNTEALTGNKLVENLSGKWLSFLTQLNTKEFARSLHMIKEEMYKAYPPAAGENKIESAEFQLIYNNETREKIAHLISDQPSTSDDLRKIIINVITEFDTMLGEPDLTTRPYTHHKKMTVK